MQLEKIIKTLAEIDMRSAKIMEATSNEKQALEEKFQARKDEYQKSSEERTKIQVDELREKLNLKMQAEIEQQANASVIFLEELDHSYEKDHSKIASDIFNSLIEV